MKKGVSSKQISNNAAAVRSKKCKARPTAETVESKGKKRKNASKKDASPRQAKKKKVSNRGTKKGNKVADEDNEPCLYCSGIYCE